MKKWNILFVFILLSATAAACRLTPGETADDLGCSEIIPAMITLLGSREIPENFMADEPVRTGEEFDPNQFFSILTRLSMEPGYTLDYVYHRDGMGAYPLLYARPVDQPRYATEAEFAASGTDREGYLEHIRVEESAESYFQFVVFTLMANQFYLDWHANYNDALVVCTQQAAVELADSLGGDYSNRMPFADRMRVRSLQEVEPAAVFGAGTVEVRITTFSNWGGFVQLHYSVSRPAPHVILNVWEEILVPYDCGIMF